MKAEVSTRRTRRAHKTRSEPRYRLTDAGNSLRYTEDNFDHLFYAVGPGWHSWDGKRWRSDNESEPYRAAKRTAAGIRREAAEIEDPKLAEAVFKWAINSESNARLKSMVDLARRGETNTTGLLKDVSDLDRHPHLLNCASGTIDLTSAALRPHAQADNLTKLTNLRYDPKAEASRWHAFLAEVFQGDEDMVAWVQRAVGYSLTGETNEQVMFIAHGDGANGKSVFMETVADVAGEWAANAAADTFIASGRGAGIPNDLARMRGARLVRVPETEDGAALARQVIKRITGGDAMTARLLYREHFEYMPAFKVWLVTNHLPSIPAHDYATWRRIRLIPFRRRFKPEERDKKLRDKLRRELPGILAWAVEGAQLWYQSGLGDAPLAAREARDAYRSSQDTLTRFCENELVLDAAERTGKTDLYNAYRDFCAAEGLRAVGRNAFHHAMRERGFAEAKVGRGDRVYTGIRLR